MSHKFHIRIGNMPHPSKKQRIRSIQDSECFSWSWTSKFGLLWGVTVCYNVCMHTDLLIFLCKYSCIHKYTYTFISIGKMYHVGHIMPQHTAEHCNTWKHTATHCSTRQHTATHCNALQHIASYSNTIQHTVTHCNTLQHTATHCNILQHTAAHYRTLQHTATHCNTLQHQPIWSIT